MNSSSSNPAELLAVLRDVAALFARLNQRVGSTVDLMAVDLECLDVIARTGPTTPTAVATALGVHPATATGIIDRLVRGGWATREPDPRDRRRVIVTALRDRGAELTRGFRPMATAMQQLLSGYSDEQLALITRFLHDTADAAQQSLPRIGDGDKAFDKSP
ncbi:MarR family transcriptional regulator [Nocardia sp. NPDC004278]